MVHIYLFNFAALLNEPPPTSNTHSDYFQPFPFPRLRSSSVHAQSHWIIMVAIADNSLSLCIIVSMKLRSWRHLPFLMFFLFANNSVLHSWSFSSGLRRGFSLPCRSSSSPWTVNQISPVSTSTCCLPQPPLNSWIWTEHSVGTKHWAM